MALGEAFTILAVLEATDRMSQVLEHVDAGLNGFSETAARAATAATEAGARIDESLLQTASGADALELADARMAAAQERVAATTRAQAEAERALIDAQAQLAAAEDGDAAASERLTAASDALAAAQKRSALAAKEADAATSHQAGVNNAAVLSTTEGRAAADEAAASQARLAEQQRLAAVGAGAASKAMKYGALAVAAIGYESIKAAGNFESMTEHLVTDAGESQQNIGMIRAGMLALATTTGTTTDQMAQGMYHIESAGFHGQQALDVLKTAAEGAKVGGADLDTIGQALTGTMNAFGPSAGNATQMMNALIATVGQGDMKLQDLGSSMGNVAAIAASAGLSYAQVGGALATMTAQNVSAQRGTQDLAHTISSLSNPTAVQIKEMTALGVDSMSLSKNLGKNGLTGTFDILVQAIAKNTKGGAVMVTSLNASKAAAAQANQIIAQMPPTMQKMAQGWQAGTVSSATFKKAIDGLPPSQQKMYLQFEQLTKKSSSFAQSLQANTPMAQTFNAALAKMTGGTTSLNTILMLSGQHAGAFKDNVAKISDAAHKTGGSVDNWDKIQGTFNQKMDVAKASMEAAGISIGTVLLPAVSQIASWIAKVVAPMATWISQHQKIVGLIAAVTVGILAGVGAMKAWAAIQGAINVLMAVFDAEATANPIGLIVVAIAALVAGLIYAYTHFKTFRDVVNTVFAVVKTTVMGAWTVLKAIWNAMVAVVQWVSSAFSTAFNAVAAVVQTVWGVISGVWDTIVSVTTTIWNGISGFFAKWWPLLLVIFATPIAILVGLWNHTHQAIFDTAKTVWNAISGFFAGVWHVITSATQTAWDLFKAFVIKPVQDVWNWIQPVLHTLASFLSGVWNGIVGAAQGAWALVKHWVIQPLLDAWNWLSGWIGKFADIGSGIINGIMNGISSGWNWLTDQISHLASSLLDAAKSALGINSPSKEFADTVGKSIPEGIAKGVTDHAHIAHNAIKALSAGLTATASASFTGTTSLSSSGVPALAGAGHGGGNVFLTVDLRGAHVSSERDAQAMANRVGSQIVRQLAQAGVKVRTL